MRNFLPMILFAAADAAKGATATKAPQAGTPAPAPQAGTPAPAPQADAAKAERKFSVVTGVATGIALPEKVKNQRSKYPFKTLEINECFGVKGKTAAEMSSSIGAAMRDFQVPKKDASGNLMYKPVTKKVKDATGNESEKLVNEVIMENTRKFVAYDVDDKLREQIKDHPQLVGSDVLVFRVAV